MNSFWKSILPGKNCTDENILAWLDDGSTHREQQALDCLYRRLIGQVVPWVLKHGGSETDGEDALVDALTGFVKTYRAGKYTDEGKLDNYVFSIAKFKFYDHCREQKRRGGGGPELSIEDVFPNGIPPGVNWEDPDEKQALDAEDLARREAVEKCFAQLDPKCQERLTRFWYQEQSHEEIAKAMGNATANGSKVMKGRCEEKLRQLVSKTSKPGNRQI